MTMFHSYTEELDEALELTYQWYEGVLPSHIESTSLPGFLANSRELAHRVMDGLPMVVDPTAISPYTDGKTITMPSFYMLPEFLDELQIPNKDRVAAATTLFNGSQIHEALHCAHTPFGKDRFCQMASPGVSERALGYLNTTEGFSSVLNLVEDVHIESWGASRFPELSSFIDAKNAVLLGGRLITRAIKMMEEEKFTIDKLLNLLAFGKNPRARHDGHLGVIAPLMEVLVKADDPELGAKDRVAIAVELWEKLMDQSGGSANNEGSRALERPSEDFGNREKYDTGDVRSTPVIGPMMFKAGSKLIDRLTKAANALTKVIEHTTMDNRERLEKRRMDLVHEHNPQSIREVGEVRWRDVLKASTERPFVSSPDPDWRRLGRHLRYLREVKTTLGIPNERGSKIVKSRLARIATDNRVLAFVDRSKVTRGRPEVNILVDASGSMTYSGLFHKVVDAAHGMFVSFMQSGVPCAIYAHTSPREPIVPLIYMVASFRMPLFGPRETTTTNYGARFSALGQVGCIENLDGFAIEEVSKRFTSRLGSKILVVLSDGEPAAGHVYGGYPARSHTAFVINKVREEGRLVISVSLIPEVVETNDLLYGPDHNLRGFGHQLESSLRELVARLALS